MNAKKIILFTFLAMLVVFAGCSTAEEITDKELSEAAYSVEANVEELRGEIDDVGFWNSLELVTNMIVNSLQPERNVSVGFRLEASDGTTILLEDAYMFNLPDINDTWRSLTTSQIEYVVGTSSQVTTAVESGQTIKVTGVIMEWIEYSGVNSTPQTISVCDIEGDGKWDYAAQGKFYFTDSPTDSIPITRDEYGAIGLIAVNGTKLIPLNQDKVDMLDIVKMISED